MKSYNRCSKGVFNASEYSWNNGWNQTIFIGSGASAREDWCFCNFKPYSTNNAFEITLHQYTVDSGDSLKWYNSYKKMQSRLVASGEINYSITVYSNVLQAMWFSDSLEFLFGGVNITVKAL